MGVEPVTATVCLGIVAVGALAAYINECEREEQRRRSAEEFCRRARREQRAREKEARRERERQEKEEQEELDRRIKEREREERERDIWRSIEYEEERIERTSRYNSNYSDHFDIPEPYYYRSDSENLFNPYDRYSFDQMGSTSMYDSMYRFVRPEPYYYRSDSENLFNPYDRYSFDPDYSYGRYGMEEDRNYQFDSLNSQQARSSNESSCGCSSCTPSQPDRFNPFEARKVGVTVTIVQPQITQNHNANSKTQGSTSRASSNRKGATNSNTSANASKPNTTSTNASKQNTNSAQKYTSSGSQQPQRNNNDNNKDNNKDGKKDTVQYSGKLSIFINKLKAVLNDCKTSPELRERILAFFDNFEKHEENFLRVLEDFGIQSIAIEDILSIVIRLFQSDYFAKEVCFENFIAVMEIVAKYLKDERFSEIVKDSFKANKQSFDKQRAECMKKVLQRKNLLSEITDLFESVRKEIVEDNTSRPLEPDFSGIFTKVYHYIKHKDFRGKELTVTKYFDFIRKLLNLLKHLDPEYAELTNINHSRREIVFEVYSIFFQGRLKIVIRAYGARLHVCTFYLNDKYDKKAKEGDKYVDGKKKK